MSLMDKVRYASEDEARGILEGYIKAESEGNFEKVKNMLISFLKSPERKVRRAALGALRTTKFVDRDIITTCAIMTKEDPEKSVRDLAAEVTLELLNVEDEGLKKDLTKSIIKLISKGKAMVDVTDIVKSIGIDFARSIVEDPEVDSQTKEYIQFAIEYLEKG